MKVVIVLPTYCEAENIEGVVEKIEEVTSRLQNYEFQILVLDDFSPDGTADKVKRLQKKFSNVILLSGKKEGLGKAYLRGMNYAVKELNAEVMFEMDADFSHDPEVIPEFMGKIETGADFVIGSRYIKGGSIPDNWGLHRKIFSVIGNLIVRIGLGIFKIHDWTSGYRAIKVAVFQKVGGNLSQYSGYTFQVVFLHRVFKAGFKIAEVPINFTDRKFGHSKIAPFDYIKNILLYVLSNSTFIKYVIVGGLSFIINAVALEIFYRMGFNPGIAAAIGAEMAIVWNYNLNNAWTFSEKKIKISRRYVLKFLQFNFTSLGAILIQAMVVGVGTFFFGNQFRLILFALAVIFFIIPYNYFIYNRFIWKTHEKA